MIISFGSYLENPRTEEMIFECGEDKVYTLNHRQEISIADAKFMRRILYYADFTRRTQKGASFNIILWNLSSAECVKYHRYDFEFTPPGQVHLKVSPILSAQPKEMALLENSEIFDFIEDVILVSEAEPVEEPGPRIIYVNKAFEKMTGYTLAEVFGKTPRILQGEKTSAEARTKLREALKDWRPVIVELLNYTKDQLEFFVELNIAPRKDEVGWWTHWISVQRDVTLRKLQETQFQHNSRLALIGELASSVGHEVNNPATIIGGLLDLTESILKESGFESDEVYQNFERMNLALKRIQQITRGLRSFSRTDADQEKVFSVRELILETHDLLQPIYRSKGVALELSVGNESFPIKGSRGRLQQVLMNLIANAKDATEGMVERKILISLFPGKNSVLLTVEDNGSGIPKELQQKIFEPFFTTKPVNHGTGLGLSLVKSFVTELKGTIDLISGPGKGTKFTVDLPLSEETASIRKKEGVVPLPQITRKGLSFLVVEDEGDLRLLLTRLIDRLGVDVTVAANGLEALQLLKENTYDLILSDIQMPILDGVGLLTQLRANGVRTKFVFTTGGDATANPAVKNLLPEINGILEKPFRSTQLSNLFKGLFPEAGF